MKWPIHYTGTTDYSIITSSHQRRRKEQHNHVSWRMKIFHSNDENPQFTVMEFENVIVKTE
jgi:hypothetical protein